MATENYTPRHRVEQKHEPVVLPPDLISRIEMAARVAMESWLAERGRHERYVCDIAITRIDDLPRDDA